MYIPLTFIFIWFVAAKETDKQSQLRRRCTSPDISNMLQSIQLSQQQPTISSVLADMRYALLSEFLCRNVKNRPYSPYPPSLLARKDWWDKSDVTWFLIGQTTNKFCQCKNSRSSFFILDKKNLKDDNGKLWVEVIIVSFFFFWSISERKCLDSKQ